MQPRVLVTRSPHQASGLAEHLRAHGLDPVLIPAIETIEPSSIAGLDSALAQLSSPVPRGYDWLLFTSANAVQAVDQRHKVLKGTSLSQSCTGLQIAAIGPATAQALREIGLEPGLIPPQAVAESFAQALLPHVRQPDGTPTRFLLIRAEEAREHLPDTLRAAGAEVTVVAAYRTVIPEVSVEALRQLFGQESAGPEAITFTSSSTARNLLALCEAAGVRLPVNSLRFSIGPITSQTLRDLNYAPHAEAPEATVASLAETVVKGLQTRAKA